MKRTQVFQQILYFYTLIAVMCLSETAGATLLPHDGKEWSPCFTSGPGFIESHLKEAQTSPSPHSQEGALSLRTHEAS